VVRQGCVGCVMRVETIRGEKSRWLLVGSVLACVVLVVGSVVWVVAMVCAVVAGSWEKRWPEDSNEIGINDGFVLAYCGVGHNSARS